MLSTVRIRDAGPEDDVSGWVHRSWGGSRIVVHGQLYDATTLPAYVAVDGTDVRGVLTYAVTEHALEIVSCDARPTGEGIGRRLVHAAVERARAASLRRVWCTTTNDNLPALGFWQSRGFRIVALRPGAVAAARRIKPEIPVTGHRGLPIRDELDLELRL
jgi:GNAT superfamily N-acetyltransferase